MSDGLERDTAGEQASAGSGSHPTGLPVDDPWLHVVLHTPEIPNNTGNIGRSCVTLNAALHLVHPLGFDIDEKAVRRAGLDYWPRLRLHEHEDFSAFRTARAQIAATPSVGVRQSIGGDPGASDASDASDASGAAGAGGAGVSVPRRTWAFSGRARRSIFDADLQLGDAFVFGCETRGLPAPLADEFEAEDRLLCLPMVAGERSLNLATSVCAAMYELIRQAVVAGELAVNQNGRVQRPIDA